MPKSIYVQFLSERPNSNPHYLNRLVNLLNHFISIEPKDKPEGFESHHITPKSWIPEWKLEKDNLIKVPAKAHYVIHHLMWKAFPKDHSMQYAFWLLYNSSKQKITAKVYEVLRSAFSETIRQIQKEKVNNGTHHLLSGEITRKTNAKRIKNGTHHWLGPKSNRKRLADGTHNLSNLVKKQLENGTHNTQIKKTCPYCGKTCSIPLYGRWHGGRCKTQSFNGASK